MTAAVIVLQAQEGGLQADYDYSNTNYALLGLVAEQVDGKPLAQAFQDRLYGPLGLENSVLPASTDTVIPDP